MKKTLIASSLAAMIGVTGFAGGAGHNAHAAEQSQSNHSNIIQFIKSGQADSKPYQAGSYNYQFSENGYDYHLYSDGTHFGYDYHASGQSNDQGVSNEHTVSQNVNQLSNNETKSNNIMQVGNKSVKLPESSNSGSVKLSNGNTAGDQGSSAAQEMAKRTGVSASTWETIIARESNGDPNAHNASGADGLFQTIGWGDTSTVQGQIDAATKAYNAQGLSAWGM